MLKPYCFAWLAGLCLLLTSPLAQAQRPGGGVATNAAGGGEPDLGQGCHQWLMPLT